HMELREGAVQHRTGLGIDLLGQIETADFGAGMSGERRDRERERHGGALPIDGVSQVPGLYGIRAGASNRALIRGADRPPPPHMRRMARTHPHAEATYTVVELRDGSFGVAVAIPDSYPTTVSPFASAADAEAWIDKHKSQVEAGAATGQWFRKPGRRG